MPKTYFPAVIKLSELNGKNGFKINGEAADDRSGSSVSNAGDINGDGFDDLLIGAPNASPAGRTEAGLSYLIFGHNGTWPAVLELSTLNGITGFKINGENAGDFFGYSGSGAGDVNHDGFSDLIIGAQNHNPGSKSYAGASYVIFGHNDTWSSELELSTLDGESGFKINGEISGDRSGNPVNNAGDINGDGIDDLIIGAFRARVGAESNAGSSYVIFGHDDPWLDTLELIALNGADGVKIRGELSWDLSGGSVSKAGDINGDGIDEFIIGAPGVDPDGRTDAGASYLIFGHSSAWSSILAFSSLNGTNGFRVNGETMADLASVVSHAGDINGDGFGDFIIGAPYASPDNGRINAGSTYAIFGHSGVWPKEFELSSLDGMTGFKINGEATSDESGHSVSSAGDINGDGFDDFIIGAILASPDGKSSAGTSYVIFGHDGGWSNELELSTLNGESGVAIHGEQSSALSGWSVSGAGDVNGDGIDDLIIGAYYTTVDGKIDAGASYVIFGDIAAALTTNQLTINEGETQSVTLANLDVTEDNHLEIWFDISALQHGYFANVSDIGTSMTLFSKEAIVNNQIRFVHDGSEFPPAYNVTVRSEKFGYSESSPAVISFTPVNDAPTITTTASPLIYTKHAISAVDSGVIVTDPDNVNLVNATIAITSNFYAGQDVLAFTDQQGISGFYNNESGVLTLTGISMVENYQTALRNVTYQNLLSTPITDIRTVTFITHDGLTSSLPAIRSVNLTAINAQPVLATTSTPLFYTENSADIAVDSGITVLDSDNVNLVNATIAITNNFFAYQDFLGFTAQYGITSSYNSESGILTLTNSASLADYQEALRSVIYRNLFTDNPTAVIRTVSFVVNDGIENSLPATRDIHVIAVNDCPTLISNEIPVVYNENAAPSIIDNNITILDFDNTQLTNATVTMVAYFDSFQDILWFTDQHGINGYYNNETGVLTLTGTANLTDYQTALRTVSYENLSDHPTTDTKTVLFIVNDGNCDSNIIAHDIQIIPENDWPILVNNRLTITEGQSVTLTSAELNATDAEIDDAGLVFTVSGVQHGEFNSIHASQSITSFAQRNITQGNIYFLHDGSHQAPAYLVRVSDGELFNEGDFQPADIVFISSNDMPILVHNALTIQQGRAMFITPADLSATDEETADADLIFMLSNITHCHFELISALGSPLFNFSQGDVVSSNIRFVHDGSSEAPTYAVSVNDGNSTTEPSNAVITFTPMHTTDDGDELLAAITAASVSGFVILCLLMTKLYLNYRATENLEKLIKECDIGAMKQQTDFQENLIYPIARAIFNQINFKGFLGYIDDRTMKSYLDAVGRLVEKLMQYGVEVDLRQISVSSQSKLIDEIVKQTRQRFIPNYGCCGHLTHFFKSMCMSDVSPEEFAIHAESIALIVANTLQAQQTVNNVSSQIGTGQAQPDVNDNKETFEAPVDKSVLIEMQRLNPKI